MSAGISSLTASATEYFRAANHSSSWKKVLTFVRATWTCGRALVVSLSTNPAPQLLSSDMNCTIARPFFVRLPLSHSRSRLLEDSQISDIQWLRIGTASITCYGLHSTIVSRLRDTRSNSLEVDCIFLHWRPETKSMLSIGASHSSLSEKRLATALCGISTPLLWTANSSAEYIYPCHSKPLRERTGCHCHPPWTGLSEQFS